MVASIGAVPPLFPSAIRLLRREPQAQTASSEQPDLLVATSAFLIRVSPSLQAVFYYAAEQLYPAQLRAITDLSIRSLIPLFKKDEIAAIVALTYLHRTIRKHCDQQEWRVLMQKMQRAMEVGAVIGQTVYGIDRGIGMLIPGMRLLALALFSREDLKRFQTYRRSLDKREIFYSPREEEELFGCTHLQVAALLVQSMGFGIVATLGLGKIEVEEQDNIDKSEREQIRAWCEAANLIESYSVTGSPPAETVTDSEADVMSVPDELAAELSKRVGAILNEQTKFDWLEAQKDSLPPPLRSALVMPLEELMEYEKTWAEAGKK